jgi:hypothetical protein
MVIASNFSREYLSTLGTGAIVSTTLIATILAYVVFVREFTSLRNIPGPFFASLSNLWQFRQTKTLQRPLIDIQLHKRYGPIVRTGPNELLVSSPMSFKTIYSMFDHYRKSLF